MRARESVRIYQAANGVIIMRETCNGTMALSEETLVFNSLDAACEFIKQHFVEEI